MSRSYTERMWTSKEGVNYNVKNGLLSVQMTPYQAQHFLSSIQALIRKITHLDTPELGKQFAKIHRLARVAYFAALPSSTLESLDAYDCDLIGEMKVDDSFKDIYLFITSKSERLRVIKYDDILDVHDVIAGIQSTMES